MATVGVSILQTLALVRCLTVFMLKAPRPVGVCFSCFWFLTFAFGEPPWGGRVRARGRGNEQRSASRAPATAGRAGTTPPPHWRAAPDFTCVLAQLFCASTLTCLLSMLGITERAAVGRGARHNRSLCADDPPREQRERLGRLRIMRGYVECRRHLPRTAAAWLFSD
jgi:hypothetical protein